MKITKYLSVIVLVLISLLLTGFSYAYWVGDVGSDEQSITNFNGETIVIGEAQGVTTVITFNEVSKDSKFLVPEGNVENSVGGSSNNTSSKTIMLPVKWEQEPIVGKKVDGVKGELSFDYTVSIGNLSAEAIARLFDISITVPDRINLNGDAVPLVVNVLFKSEPKDETEYNAVINEELKFVLNFSVEQVSE